MNSINLICQSAYQQFVLGNWAEAAQLAELGLRHDPHHGRLHEVAGVAAYHQEEYGPAVYHLESASAVVPLRPESQLVLAELYLRFGQTESAGAILEFLAEPEGCPIPLLPDLAKVLGRAGAYRAALEVCERLTTFRPTFHPAWFGVAFYLKMLGRPISELELPLRCAFNLAPHAITYRLNLAVVLIDLGQITEGYRLIDSLPPEVVRCPCQCRRFAAACAALGDHDQAAGFLSQAERLTGKLNDTAESDPFSQQTDLPRLHDEPS